MDAESDELVRHLQREVAEMKRYIYHGPKKVTRDRTVLDEFSGWLKDMKAAIASRRTDW